jgi:hypothetical protein
MVFDVGKRVVAGSPSQRIADPARVSLRRYSEAILASLSDPLGRRPRGHLHARERRPSSWAKPQAAEASGTTQAPIDLRGHERRAGKASANSFRFTGHLPGRHGDQHPPGQRRRVTFPIREMRTHGSGTKQQGQAGWSHQIGQDRPTTPRSAKRRGRWQASPTQARSSGTTREEAQI